MSLISINNLSKKYGSIEALKGVSFEIPSGSTFALLGPNGAGKTSLLKSILGLVKYKGNISIADIDAQNPLSRKNIAYLPEKFSFYDYYTVAAVLDFYGRMRGVDKTILKDQIENACQKVKIDELKNRKLTSLSKGQLQRLGLATTLIGDNHIIFLDEPFSGLDPIGIKDMKDLISEMVQSDKTVFINSHILSEIEKLCDQFAIINKGKLLEVNTISALNGKTLEDYFYDRINQ